MKNELVHLVEKFTEFIAETGTNDLKAFSVWLSRSLERSPDRTLKVSETQTERDISYFINRLSRFSKFYTRKVLANYDMISIDEFYVLLSIAKLSSPSKNDVYRDTITEVTTGAQIMRRLINNGLVREIVDRKDKRMKRVSLTPKGMRRKEEIFEDFTETVKLKTGNLSKEEKETLRRLLLTLHDFHTRMYDNDSDKSIKYLLENYIMP